MSVPLARPAARAATMSRPVALARLLSFPIVIGVLSRLFSIGVLLWVPVRLQRHPPPLLTLDRSPFAAWDAQWYLHIAATGYHAAALQPGPNGGHHDFAFYPAWPLLVRAASLLHVPLGTAAIVLANVLFVAALAIAFAVMERRFGSETARRGALLLAFAPAAYVFSMGYSEPLFLLLAASYFALRGSRFRPLVAALSMLARVTGIALAGSALIVALRDREHRGELLRSVVGVGVAFAGWVGFIWALTGKPTGWLLGSPSWEKVAGPAAVQATLLHPHGITLAWLAVVALALLGALLALRRDLELGLYSVGAIAISLAGAPVGSMPRHALIAFPAFAILGERLGGRWTVILAVVFALMQVWFASVAFGVQPRAP